MKTIGKVYHDFQKDQSACRPFWALARAHGREPILIAELAGAGQIPRSFWS